jgi:DNA-binding NarL/FixJ family response regulator
MSNAQTDILRRAARGENRDTIAAFRSSSPSTVKRQIVDLLQKTGDESLHAAIERLTRETVEA